MMLFRAIIQIEVYIVTCVLYLVHLIQCYFLPECLLLLQSLDYFDTRLYLAKLYIFILLQVHKLYVPKVTCEIRMWKSIENVYWSALSLLEFISLTSWHFVWCVCNLYIIPCHFTVESLLWTLGCIMTFLWSKQ